ncbi:MAG: tetratricopeptide repeat protein [Acidobacteriota bacterium]
MKQAILIGALALAAVGAAYAQKDRKLKSQEEQKALQAVVMATTPDERITAGEEFITKFPKSDFRYLALFSEAQSFQAKNDYEKMVIYGERTLESDPDDATKLQAQLLLATGIAQRTREFDLDREEKLGRVEKYANGALDMLKTIGKPNPNLPDDQWESFKGQMASQAHEALGLASLVRKNNDQAISEFKAAVASSKDPDPAAEVRLAAAYNKAGKYDEAIPILDKLIAKPDLHPTIRQFAQAERARAIQAKGGAAPAAPSAPAPAPAAPAPKP